MVVLPEFDLLELREVSFKLSPDLLRRVAAFLTHHADAIEAGALRTDHVHIEEFDPNWRRDCPELDVIGLVG